MDDLGVFLVGGFLALFINSLNKNDKKIIWRRSKGNTSRKY